MFISVGIISWSLFLNDWVKLGHSGSGSDSAGFAWSDFFVSAYFRPQSDLYWFLCTVLGFLSILWLGPVFWLWERGYKRYDNGQIRNLRPALTEEEQIIPQNKELKTNYLLGVTASVAALAVAAVFLYGLVMAQNYVVQTYGNDSVQIGSAVVPISVGTGMSLVVALGNF